ncbi:MAG: magnesium/cobalt transporter CorA [Desulfuromonadales bacterium]|nr:magnesium/cobalt transporter CorA [Desulfuromonadales bacterium]
MKYSPRINLDFLKHPINRTLLQVRAKPVGLPPGTLEHVGERRVEQPSISLIRYDPTEFSCQSGLAVAQATALREGAVHWINLCGIHDIAIIQQLGERFGIHLLALEDILNTGHRPKLDEYDGYSLIVLKMLFWEEETQTMSIEQVSLVLGANYVLSCQEREGDVFDGVRERLRRASGRIRQRGADYLAYALLDSVVDSYFHILEKIGDGLIRLEEDLIGAVNPSQLTSIHHYKRELLLMRRAVWPLRDLVNQLQKEESPLVDDGTRLYLRDLYDHTVQVIDTLEIFRDTLTGLQDLYMSSVSNRMNEIMKVLTIMASIFIPLTFVAGIYGMNFEYMPELRWRWGYFAVLGLMLGCAAGMLVYFRRRSWL